MCHGLNGTVGDRAPALAAARRYLRSSDRDLFDAIRNGIPGTLMPPFSMPENDVWSVVAYIRSLRATAIDSPVEGDRVRGGEIFRGKGRCLECHTVRGSGGFLGPDLSNIARERSLNFLRDVLTKPRPNHARGYRAAHVVTAQGRTLRGIVRNENNFSVQFVDTAGKLHLFARGELRELAYEPRPLMPVAADSLSAGEIQDLLAFLARLTRDSGPTLSSTVARPAGLSFPDLLRPTPANWISYNGSYNSQRHSLLKQIDIRNVHALAPRWIFHVPGAQRLESVPVVVDGVMYVSQPNEVYALDARTGRLIWEHHRQPALHRGPNRGVAVYGSRVYFGTPDAHLVALDALTGNLLWDVQMADPKDGYWCPVAPLALKDRIIVGIAPGDHGLNGWLDAYDAQTGKRLWRWWAVPRPGEPGSQTWPGDSWKTGGGDTWLTGSYDPQLNLIYWGIGNPAPDFNGDSRMGDNLYTECMVALDADSGRLQWYFQFTPHDVYDWDSVEIPILVDAPYQGRPRKLLVQANRNGFYYVLDRTSGRFLHGTPFVQRINWASGLAEDGRPMRVPGVEPSLQGTKVCPATAGATNWMSPAYNPETNWFYVVAMEGCGINTKSADSFQPGGHPFMATGYIESPEEPWEMHVRALDLTTGKLQWDYPQIGSRSYGAGLLSTAGGLIFAGDDQGVLTALDARTGKALWHFNNGQRISASPITYSVEGRQYVALSAGSNVVAFGLP